MVIWSVHAERCIFRASKPNLTLKFVSFAINKKSF